MTKFGICFFSGYCILPKWCSRSY